MAGSTDPAGTGAAGPSGADSAQPAGVDGPQPVAEEAARPRRHRRVVRRGSETEVVSGVSADERSAGWSEAAAGNGEGNDDQLRRDVPPHW